MELDKKLRRALKHEFRKFLNEKDENIRFSRFISLVSILVILIIAVGSLEIYLINSTYGLQNVIESVRSIFETTKQFIGVAKAFVTGSALASFNSNPAISFDRDFYTVGERAVLTVTDANADRVAVRIWSTADREGIALALEPKSHAQFEGTFVLANGESVGGSLNVSDGGMLVAKYSHQSGEGVEEIFAEALIAG